MQIIFFPLHFFWAIPKQIPRHKGNSGGTAWVRSSQISKNKSQISFKTLIASLESLTISFILIGKRIKNPIKKIIPTNFKAFMESLIKLVSPSLGYKTDLIKFPLTVLNPVE